MNRFFILILLADLAFAHLPPTPASLRRTAVHKKKLDGSHLPSTVVHHRRLSVDEILNLDHDVQILGQPPDGLVPAIVNGLTTTSPPDRAETPIPSFDTSSPSPEPPAPASPSPSETVSLPSSSSDPVKFSSQDCGPFGLLCHSSNEIFSSTEVPPSPPTSNPTGTSNPPPQTSQPPPTTDTSPLSTIGDLCLLLGIRCPRSSTLISGDIASIQPPPVNSDPVATQPPPSSKTGGLCLLFGINCPPSSTPVSNVSVSSQLPPTGSDLASTRPPPVSSDPVETQQLPPDTTGNLCFLFDVSCPLPSIPLSSDSTPTRPPVGGEPPESTQLSIGANLPPFTTLPSTSRVSSSGPPSAAGVSIPLGSSTSIPSIIFPSESSDLPSSSTPNSLINSIPTSGPTPTSTQFGWLTWMSLIFSSISKSISDGLSFTDPDQVPTVTSFSTAGTPSFAPGVTPLPPGIPVRIFPGAGGVNPEVDDLNGFTLIAILFDYGLSWDTVVHNPDSPGQIFSQLPVLIDTVLGITADQVKPFVLQVWIPNSYKGPSDISQLGTTWLGYIPTPHVETLVAQIKVRTSLFYTGKNSPYSDLASHINPSFDIMTVTEKTGIPGSWGSNKGSTGDTSDDSHTRENAIVGVVSALGGITLVVLGYLIYRAVKKRRELAHRRLSDPLANHFIGEAPPNRTFDQDSTGGQRRKSFYFVEDSLRGFSDHNHDRMAPAQPRADIGVE